MKPRQSKTKLSTLIICIVAGTAMVLLLAPAPKRPVSPPPPIVRPAFGRAQMERQRLEAHNWSIDQEPEPEPPKKIELPPPFGLSYLNPQRPAWFYRLGIGKPAAVGAEIGTPETQAIFAAFLADLLRDDANGNGLLDGQELTRAEARGYPRPFIVWMFKTMLDRVDADMDGSLSAAERQKFYTTCGVRETASDRPQRANWALYDADKDGRLNRAERIKAAAQLDAPIANPSRSFGGSPFLTPLFTAANRPPPTIEFPADACFLPAGLATKTTGSAFPTPRSKNLAAPEPLAALADGDNNGWIDDNESYGLLWAILQAYDRNDDGQIRGREERALAADVVFDEAVCHFFPKGDTNRDGWFSREETQALLPPILKVYDFNHNGSFDLWEKFRFSRDTWKALPGTPLTELCQQGNLADRQFDQQKRERALADIHRRSLSAFNQTFSREEQEAAWQDLLIQGDTNQNGQLEPAEIFQIEQEVIISPDNGAAIMMGRGFPKPAPPNADRKRVLAANDTDGNGILSLTEWDNHWQRLTETENPRWPPPPDGQFPAAYRATLSPSAIAANDLDGDGHASAFEMLCKLLQQQLRSISSSSLNSTPATVVNLPVLNKKLDQLYISFIDWNRDNQLTGTEAKASQAIFLTLFDLDGDGQLGEQELLSLSRQHFYFPYKRGQGDEPAYPRQAAAPMANPPIYQPPVINETDPGILSKTLATVPGSPAIRSALAAFLDDLLKNDRDGDGRLTGAETDIAIEQGMPKTILVRLDEKLSCFDRDGDGKISPAERELFLDLAGGPASTVHAWIARLDENQDGRLDHRERSQFMGGRSHPFAASAGLRVAIPPDERQTFFLNYQDQGPAWVFVLPETRAELVLLPTEEICKQADLDHDGWLNQTEALAARRATFLAADRNHSGLVEVEEGEVWAEALSLETALWRFYPDADANRDGWLDQAEIAQALPKLLAAYDFNHDGQLDDWERNCLSRHLNIANLPATATLAEMKQLGGAADQEKFIGNNAGVIYGLRRRLTRLAETHAGYLLEKKWDPILRQADGNRNGKLDLEEAFWLDRRYVSHGEENVFAAGYVNLFQKICDTNGNGEFDQAECDASRNLVVNFLDKDGNGVLSLAEALPLRILAGENALKAAQAELLGNMVGTGFLHDLKTRSVHHDVDKLIANYLLPSLDLDQDGKITMWEIQSFNARFSPKSMVSDTWRPLEEKLMSYYPCFDFNKDRKLTGREKDCAIGILLALVDKEGLGQFDAGIFAMAYREFEAPAVRPGFRPGFQPAPRKPTEAELLQRYDLDGDGKLSPAERARAMEDQKTDAGKHIVAPPEDE
jgi:Ca2+-binding EF-hand superfamily protein